MYAIAFLVEAMPQRVPDLIWWMFGGLCLAIGGMINHSVQAWLARKQQQSDRLDQLVLDGMSERLLKVEDAQEELHDDLSAWKTSIELRMQGIEKDQKHHQEKVEARLEALEKRMESVQTDVRDTKHLVVEFLSLLKTKE